MLMIMMEGGGGRLLFNSTGGSASAPIPAGSCPTVTLHTAAVDLLIIEAVIEIEAVEVEDFARGILDFREEGVEFHGSGRLVDVISLQGQGISQAPGRTEL